MTRGRFYFNDNAPFYPGQHNLWSSAWISDEQEEGSLGEVKGAVRYWDNGAAPSVTPLPQIVGSPACLRDGEPLSGLGPLRPLIEGFELGCFLKSATFSGLMASSCEDWKWSLELITRLYAGDLAAINAWVAARFPLATVQTSLSLAGPQPGWCLIIMPTWSAVHLAGTENFQQFALQAFGIATGQTNFLDYSTLLFWEEQARNVAASLSVAGLDGSRPIYIAGHSYGGIVGCLLAAKFMLAGSSPANTQLVTFGSPQPGDARLRTILGKCQAKHFINQYDPVPYLPPGATEFLLLAGYTGAILRSLWGSWHHAIPLIGVNESGVYYDNPSVDSVFPIVIDSIRRLLLGFPQPVFTAHLIGSYQAKIACPGDIPMPVVNTVTCPDSSIIVSPNSGDVLEILNMSFACSWLVSQTFGQPDVDTPAVLIRGINAAVRAGLEVESVSDDTESLIVVRANIGGVERFAFRVGCRDVLMTGSVHIGTAGPDRPYAMLINPKHHEEGVIILRLSKNGSPGYNFMVTETGYGVMFGIAGDGSWVTDNTDTGTLPVDMVGGIPLLDSSGNLVGYIPVMTP